MPFDEEDLDPHGECRHEIEQLRKVVDAAKFWFASRTEYLIECEIALAAQAPIVGGEKYRAQAADSAHASSVLAAAIQEYEKSH